MPMFQTAVQQGLDAQLSGDTEGARYALLRAAQLLLADAKRTDDLALRRTRLAQAERVKRHALALTPHTATPSTKAPPAVPVREDASSTPSWLLAERPHLRLDDVAGLDDAKEQIHLKLIYPFTHAAAATHFGVRPGGGILLYGPPGVGKTYIARAVAGELDAAFFAAKSSDLMSQWVGKAEQNVAALFAAARGEERAVIFLDEVEALVPKRSATSSSVMPRVISEFLSQTQSLGDDAGGAVLLMGATNEPWAIDPAALRPGRFDELIYVGLPDAAARARLLQLNLRDKPLASDVDVDALTAQLAGYSGADIAYICTRAAQLAFLDAVERDIDRTIDAADFAAVMTERRPSVTQAQLARYASFRQGR